MTAKKAKTVKKNLKPITKNKENLLKKSKNNSKPTKSVKVGKNAKKEVKKSVSKVVKAATKNAKKNVAKKPLKAQKLKKIEKSPKVKNKKIAKVITQKPSKVKKAEAVKKENLQNKSVKEVVEIKNIDRANDSKKNNVVKKLESRSKVSFKIGDYAVYPSHGVGKIVDIEKTTILGQDFSCYLMYFEKEKLTIKIPVNSADKVGLRQLVQKEQMDEVFIILRSGIKKLKGMWSRRAQEYETKINSGDIILLAEVLRDLTRDIEDSERSYSERIIYETAIYRLASEYSVIYGVSFEEAKDKVILTAKDKINSEGRIVQKDDFDDFDDIDKVDRDEDEDEEEGEDDEDEDEDDDDYDYDDDDDSPKRGRKRK